jgi:uncharacterized protein
LREKCEKWAVAGFSQVYCLSAHYEICVTVHTLVDERNVAIWEFPDLESFSGGLIPVQQLVEFAALLIFAGVVAGFLAGLFGIGGGTVLVPAFFQVFGAIGIDDGVRMHLAVGTSTAVVIATSITSFIAHRKRGTVDEKLLRSWLVPVPAGTFIAILVVAYISSETLRVLFAVICIVIALKLLIGRDQWRLGADLPGNPIRAIVGAIIGFFSTLMGIGGGVLNNTFMAAYGRPIHQAVSTSAGVGTLISVPGCIGFIWAGWGEPALPLWSTGYVNWFAAALVIPLTLWVTPFGVKVAHAAPKRKLEVALGLYLIFVAARFLSTLIA